MADAQSVEQYQALLSQGHDLAWAEDWQGAAKVYRQALTLRDDDPFAYLDLGLALFEMGDLEAALEAYQKASSLNPEDISALQKIAEIHLQRDEKLQAATMFLLLGDAYMRQRQPAEAVRAWQQVVRHDPYNRTAYTRLAEAYRRGRRRDLAAQAVLAHARVCAESGKEQDAVELARQALEWQPDLVAAEQLIERLLGPQAVPSSRRGTGSLRRGTGALRGSPAKKGSSPLDYDSLQIETSREEILAEAGPNPAELAKQRALARIAEAFFAGESVDLTMEAMKARAVDLQMRGQTEEAAKTFEEIIEAGGGSEDVYYALGTLYQSILRWNDALRLFRRVTSSTEYGMAAYFAIGEVFQSQGRMDEAAQAFSNAVATLDLEHVERDDVDQVMRVYEGLIDSYAAQGQQQRAQEYMNELSDLLHDRGWEDKLLELNTRLGGEFETEDSSSELLDAQESELVLRALEAARRYRERGLQRAAVEELYWALSLAPHYLPMHRMLAELFLELGHPEDAVAKLLAMAELYEIRAAPSQAIQVLRRALEISPAEQQVRSHLIDLLTAHGEIDEALEHYLYLAESYYQFAQVERAVEKLNEALRLAPRGSPSEEWPNRIQRRLADIYMQRLDWRRAAAAFEHLAANAPDDLEVAQRLVDLYFKLGAQERALASLENTANYLLENQGPLQMMQALESQVELRDDEPALWRLMGEMQVEMGDTEGAAKSWERAVELLVRQGERGQGAGLLRRILALQPAQAKRYRAMLDVLTKR